MSNWIPEVPGYQLDADTWIPPVPGHYEAIVTPYTDPSAISGVGGVDPGYTPPPPGVTPPPSTGGAGQPPGYGLLPVNQYNAAMGATGYPTAASIALNARNQASYGSGGSTTNYGAMLAQLTQQYTALANQARGGSTSSSGGSSSYDPAPPITPYQTQVLA